MITAELASKQTVVEALNRAMNEDGIPSIRSHWDIYMSPEQHAEFGDSYVLFESCVRRRYNLMTGDTL